MFNQKKEQKKMKKFWNLMLAALVIIGAAACTENNENVENAQEAAFSFYAEIVNDTRATISKDGTQWKTVWQGGEELIVNDKYTFTCTDATTGKFVCYDDEVATLVGQNVTVASNGMHHSLEGKSAFYTTATVENFGEGKVELQPLTSFFHYTFNGTGNVTFTLTADAFRTQDGTYTKEITVSNVKGENFVAFWPTAEKVTFSYTINGKECKSVTRTFEPGMVYNLGTFIEPGVASEWALLGGFSSWSDKSMVTTTVANVVVLKNVTLKPNEGFLVRKPSTDWADKYGAGNVNYIKANHYIVTSKGGADMCVEKEGAYDVYFNTSNHNLYIMTVGTDFNTATKQTVSGEEPKQEEPEVTDKVVYLKPNGNWTQSNARFAAYFFGGSTGEKWVNMTACGDGTYEAHLPEGYDYGCNIIFCRMNPSTTANNWNNKWNQTSDLKTPTDGTNLYTVKDGTWDKGGGTWSTK